MALIGYQKIHDVMQDLIMAAGLVHQILIARAEAAGIKVWRPVKR